MRLIRSRPFAVLTKKSLKFQTETLPTTHSLSTSNARLVHSLSHRNIPCRFKGLAACFHSDAPHLRGSTATSPGCILGCDEDSFFNAERALFAPHAHA